MDVYQEKGYKDREDYINSLKDEYGDDVVDMLLNIMPETEDFDGLVSALEDYSDIFC